MSDTPERPPCANPECVGGWITTKVYPRPITSDEHIYRHERCRECAVIGELPPPPENYRQARQ